MASKISLISPGSPTATSMGWVEARASISRASFLSSLWKSSHIPHSGKRASTALTSIQDANPSLSQRSSHQSMVTRSPNHWWAISWATTMATRWRFRAEAPEGGASKAVSRKVMAPQFSMAPAAKSGIAIRSSLGRG
ncbi:MAG: hypothetical protein M1313_08035 [Nitrospirae bacterium]|nr:hypothetical protein [Nitrospirota bacterium]